jgi:hypothetical protein
MHTKQKNSINNIGIIKRNKSHKYELSEDFDGLTVVSPSCASAETLLFLAVVDVKAEKGVVVTDGIEVEVEVEVTVVINDVVVPKNLSKILKRD